MDARVADGAEFSAPQLGEPENVSSIVQSSLGVLRRRWRMLAAITIVVFGAATILVMMMPPKFVAVTRVRIDPSRSAAMGQLTEQSSLPDQAVVETEVSVVKSAESARAVVQQLNLVNDKEFSGKLAPLPRNPTPAQLAERVDAVAANLSAAVSAEREKSTYIIDLSARSTDSVKAARIANAFAQQYIESTVNRRTGTAQRQSNFLDKRLSELADEAAAADQKLAQYQASAGLVSLSSGNTTVTDQQIAPLASQLATAESEAAAARAKVSTALAQIRTGGIEAVSAVLNSEVIRNLRAQRAQLLAAKSEVSTRYGPKHPETMKVDEQLRVLDGQLNDEAKRVISGLQSEASAATARANSLKSDLASLRQQRAEVTRSSAQAETYQRQADASKAAYDRLAQQAQSTSQAAQSSLSQASVVESATPPTRPSEPKKNLLLAAAFCLAFALGGATIVAQEIMSAGLKTVTDVRRLGLEVLATVPRLESPFVSRSPAASYVVKHPMGSFSEAFRVIRHSLALGARQSPRVIAITSTLPNEGKTSSALSLARVMAFAGERTLVIDTDLRRAGILSSMGVEASIGLAEVLRGEASVEDAIIKDQVENVFVLPIAQTIFSPEDMFSGNAMPDLLAKVRDHFDHIILDCPPLLGVADARTVATLADAVILMIRWNHTPKNAIKSALSWLAMDKANVVGAVLTMVDSYVEAYGAVYYSKKYKKYYREQ